MFANRERREFREASDLEFDEDLDNEGDFVVVTRGREIFEASAWSLLSPPLNRTMQICRIKGILDRILLCWNDSNFRGIITRLVGFHCGMAWTYLCGLGD